MKIYSDVFNFPRCHSNVLKNPIQIHIQEKTSFSTSEKKDTLSLKWNYRRKKTFSDNMRKFIRHHPKNCVLGLLHENADVKNSLRNTCEGVQH